MTLVIVNPKYTPADIFPPSYANHIWRCQSNERDTAVYTHNRIEENIKYIKQEVPYEKNKKDCGIGNGMLADAYRFGKLRDG